MLPKLLLLVLTIQYIQVSNTQEKSDLCGPLPWQAFGDDKCFSLLPTKSVTGDLLNYAEALSLCQKDHSEATFPSIGSPEEQNFLMNMLRAGSMWLGGKLNNSKIIWDDESTSNYSNWSSYIIIPDGQFCITLGDDANAHGHGKWMFTNCSKKSIISVVCQKPQTWAPSKIQKYVQKHFKIGVQKLLENEQEILALRHELQSYKEEIANLKRQAQVPSNSSTANLIPIGFVYIQYKDQTAPSVLWPKYAWTEISSEFAGQFFRAVGGSSSSFGTTQTENCPRITRVEYADTQPPNAITVPVSGTSEYIRTGPYSSNSDTVGISFTSSGGEVRPYNSAVRIWKRTG